MKTRDLLLSALFSMMFTGPILADPVTEALKNTNRSEQDLKTDVSRKPAEFMHFLDVKPGMTVLDIFSGGGYYTEIASLIVGEKGKVDAHNNKAYVNYIGEEKLSSRYKESRLLQCHPNYPGSKRFIP